MESSNPADPHPLIKGDLDERDILELVDSISKLLSEEIGSNARINSYLNDLKLRAGRKQQGFSDAELRELIMKHPYFKNPCQHPIRIISIMKYLKRKGYSGHSGFESRIDSIVSSIDGVERLEFGRYKINGV